MASFLGGLIEPGDALMICRCMLGLKHESLVFNVHAGCGVGLATYHKGAVCSRTGASEASVCRSSQVWSRREDSM